MNSPVHVAITRRVRKDRVAEFERELLAFASASLTDPHSRGVHLLYPAPDAKVPEYGILRSFENEEARDAFYRSEFYLGWVSRIGHLIEGNPVTRELTGLEAWFRGGISEPPPRWKMALLTWAAVWPVSMAVPKAVIPLIREKVPAFLHGGVVSAGIVVVLTWLAMPPLVKAAHRWIHPESPAE